MIIFAFETQILIKLLNLKHPHYIFFVFILLQPLKAGKPSWTETDYAALAETADTWLRHVPLFKGDAAAPPSCWLEGRHHTPWRFGKEVPG